jgi:phenylalanyl-tRNA synthetase alpha chain
VTADLHSVAAEALEAIAAAPDLATLDAVRAKYLGRGDGLLTAFRRGLGKIPDADGRRQMGQMVNELVERVTDAADERQRSIEATARAQSLETEGLDLTRPAPALRRGRLNPVTGTTSRSSTSRRVTPPATRRTPSTSTIRACSAPTPRRCRSGACSSGAHHNG